MGNSARIVTNVLRTASGFCDELIRNAYLRGLGIFAFLAYVVLGTTTLSQEGGDYWQHLAAVRALSSNLLSPSPLYFSETYEVHLYTPYHVFWGAVRAVSGLDIWSLLILMGTANAVLFVVGCRLLAKYVFRDPKLDVAALVVFLTFWYHPIWWSGVYSLGQLPLQASYPSFFALAASLILAAIWMEEGFRDVKWFLAVTVVLAFLFATHPVTTSFLLLLLGAKTLTIERRGRRQILITGTVVAGGLLIGLLWPYYSLLRLIASAQTSEDFFGAFDVFYRGVRGMVGPELLGFLALPLVSDRRLRLLLASVLGATLAIYAGNYLLEVSPVFSRYLIFTTFALHLCIVAALAAVQGRRWSAVVITVCVITAGMAGLEQLRLAARYNFGIVQDIRQGVPLGTNSMRSRYREMAALAAIQESETRTVMTPLEWSSPIIALTDYNVVGVMDPDPTMPHAERRRSDVNLFYDANTSQVARDTILRRWDADYVLVAAGSPIEQQLTDARWAAVHRADDLVLFGVPQAAADSLP